MRVPIVAGNWKMHKTVDEAVAFVNEIKDHLPDSKVQETALAAPTLDLTAMVKAAKGSPLKVAAENCYCKNEGAYTGETSPSMLWDAGIHHVILGHSERRRLFHEDDQLINAKVKAALKVGICPIVCCDETMGRLINGKHAHWVVSRIIEDLKGLTPNEVQKVTIAYEPTWAIGTGQSADPEQAEEGCYLIRQTIEDMFTQDLANQMRILYGGSVNVDNINRLMDSHDIDGVLVGTDSLDPQTFLRLVNH